MHFLFRNCKIVDPSSSHNLTVVDIRIRSGLIDEIGVELPLNNAKVLAFDGWSVSPAFIDLEAEVGDPGKEHIEDLETLSRAALAGGFLQLGIRPHTIPVIHDKAGVSYLMQQSRLLPITVWPIGALSRDTKGLEITEMMDMRESGAIAFSDGRHPVQHAGLMQRALLYVKSFDGLIMSQALDKSIAGKGQIHEGVVSTILGMTGVPSLAEELMIERDLKLLEYTDSRLHISYVSTAKGVENIRRAKAQGLKVTASVSALHLLHTVEALKDYDSYFKVMPPLRSQADRVALIEGLKDGTIDCIASNHCPREPEAKALEFSYADFGAAMLSTAFAAARTGLADKLSELELLNLFTYGPARIFDVPLSGIEKGNKVALTFYQYDESWTPTEIDIKSKSKNAPLVGQELKGKVIGVAKGEQIFGF